MFIRKSIFILVVLTAFAAVIVDQHAFSQAAPGRKPRVAVLDFDYATVQASSAAIFGNNVDIGKGISALLVTDLVKSDSYSVIERSAIDKVLAEQDFSNSNRADPTTAARIGKVLGVDYIILGSITEFGNETKKQNVGGGGTNFHGFGLGGVGHSSSKANVVIDARIIKTDTAEILVVAEGKGQSSRSGVSLLGTGGNSGGLGGGNVDFGSSKFQNTIIGEATKKAVDQLTTDLVTNVAKLPVHTMAVDALVAAVDGGQIVLNAGARAGINKGDQFSVVRLGKEIKDPASGKVIRRMVSNIGTIQATDVDDTSAVCNVVSGTGFQVSDHAVTPGTSPSVSGSTAPAAASEMAPAPKQSKTSTGSRPTATAASQPTVSANQDSADQGSPDQSASAQPNFTAIKAEFVPGEKTLFFDDFSDMSGDDAPPHWKIRGATPELHVAGSTRQLALIGDNFDIYPNITGLPKNFTMEVDMLCEKDGGNVGGCSSINWYFHDKSGRTELLKIWTGLDRATEDGKSTEWRCNIASYQKEQNAQEVLGEKTLTTDWKHLVKLAMWVQNGRLRFYVNGERVFDFNQVDVVDIASLQINFSFGGGSIMAIRRARFAESTPDFSQTILSSGKFVTHGILFDTDSDSVKPESAAVIQQIAKGLQQNTDLKVEIDGHTDSTGAAAHNMDLSKRRAEAVKNILVSQFSIEAGRLTTAGFGSSKPLDSNNTAAGKAQNRRVEFVRK